MAFHLVVCGVMGTQGSSVAKEFSRIPNWRVTGLTRSTQSSAAQKIATLGATFPQVDLEQPSTLVDACRTADAIFANTDFFGLMKYPDLSDLLTSKHLGQSLSQASMDHKTQQGKNIIDTACQVVAEGGPLTRFV